MLQMVREQPPRELAVRKGWRQGLLVARTERVCFVLAEKLPRRGSMLEPLLELRMDLGLRRAGQSHWQQGVPVPQKVMGFALAAQMDWDSVGRCSRRQWQQQMGLAWRPNQLVDQKRSVPVLSAQILTDQMPVLRLGQRPYCHPLGRWAGQNRLMLASQKDCLLPGRLASQRPTVQLVAQRVMG